MGKLRSQLRLKVSGIVCKILSTLDQWWWGWESHCNVVVEESWMVFKQNDPNGILCKSRKLKRILSQQHCYLNVEIMYTAIFICKNAAWKQSYLLVAQVSVEKVSVYFPFSFLVCIFWMWRWQYCAFWIQSWLYDVCTMGKLFKECGFGIIFN